MILKTPYMTNGESDITDLFTMTNGESDITDLFTTITSESDIKNSPQHDKWWKWS